MSVNSPADFSDIKKGDIISKVNGTKILSFDKFEELQDKVGFINFIVGWVFFV